MKDPRVEIENIFTIWIFTKRENFLLRVRKNVDYFHGNICATTLVEVKRNNRPKLDNEDYIHPQKWWPRVQSNLFGKV